jgi:ubiquinone/menaquinone biosynthesis C-methylase UbiE
MSQEFWSHQASLPGLRAVIDPNDSVGRKNAYIDCLHKVALQRYGWFRSTDRVLDFGCGLGRLSVWLAERAASIHGVEANLDMIRRAAEACRQAGARNVTLTLYDGTQLPFESKTFTRVNSVWVLQHVLHGDQLRAVLRELGRVCTSAARMVFVERVSKQPDEPWLPKNVIVRRPYAEYQAAFADSGLRCVMAKPIWDIGPICGSERIDRWVKSGRVSPPIYPTIARIDMATKPWRTETESTDYVFCCVKESANSPP